MNTKQLKMMIAVVFVALFTIQEILAQQGMDYAGGPTFRYARLRKTVNQNSGNEKALGVYNADILPSSTLEINTTTTYLPFLHPNLGGDRGLAFRSVAPAGFTQQWQMFRDNTQVFRLFNTQNTDDITLETSLNGNLIFHTNATERLRITAAGSLQGWPGSIASGLRSIAFGFNTTASGDNTQAFGQTTIASGPNAAAFGSGNTVNGGASFASGIGNVINGSSSAIFGNSNSELNALSNGNLVAGANNQLNNCAYNFVGGFTNSLQLSSNNMVLGANNTVLNSTDCGVIGSNNSMAGQRSFCLGNNVIVTSNASNAFVGGSSSIANGNDCFAYGSTATSNAQTAFALGENVTSNGVLSFTLGTGNVANGGVSFAIGTFTETNGFQNYSIGTGLGLGQKMNNGIDNSFAVGFLSTIPTFFIEPPANPGAQAIGRVGIATTSPQTMLHVANSPGALINDGFIRTDPLATASLTPYTVTTDDGLVIADIDGTLITKLQFTGNNTDVLLGDGTWGTGGGGFGSCVSPTTFGGSGGAVNLSNTDNFHFLGNNSGNLTVDNVMIGATSCVTPAAKLHVLQSSTATGSNGILVENNDASTLTTPSVGVKSILAVDPTCTAIAAWLEAPSANMAVCQPYALFVPHNGGRISINYPYNDPAAIPWMLALNGAANSPVGWFTVSDQAFKTNLDTISNPLEKIKHINGVYFEFDTLNYPNYNFPTGKQVGFIAQNIDTILPEAVSNNGAPLSLDYAKITPLLLEAVKALNKKVEALETQLNQCCQNNNMNNNKQNNNSSNNTNSNKLGNAINVELNNGDAIVLDQNAPNPFAENTSINYYIPENTGYAQIIFTDMHGRIIKTVDIKQSGNSQLKVYAANLSQGIYQYSIVVDGKVIDTKKMVVEK